MTASRPVETVMITGASSGIGLELAKLFAADRSDLVLVARREERLAELARSLRERHGVNVAVVTADLGQPSAPRELLERCQQDGITVDVLVNNAGCGAHGRVAELPLERQLEMIAVNVTALAHLTRLFLPGMLTRGRGGILNVASTAAFQPGPYMAVYYASKAFVLFFSEALTEELAGTPITVTCLAPGPTRTEFAEAAHTDATRLLRLGSMDAAAVARAGFCGFRARRALAIPGLRNRLGVWSVRLGPRSVVRKVVAFFNA
jgi:short-subunit dehydrogenase